MATYKVIQDIEAEDKLLGPLTLRQFIYAAIAVVCLYLSYLMIAKHAAFMLVIFLPVALLSGFFAFPWKRDQPTEVWALAKIRFMFKPRRRVWDQSGLKELVTITAPKVVEVNYTNGLSQPEVKSRLRALADTIDSRGWAVKNVNVNLSSQPQVLANATSSDRLIDVGSLPQAVSNVDIKPADDILDEHSNPVAQHFDQMINSSEQTHRQNIVQSLQQVNQTQSTPQAQPRAGAIAPPNNYWFMDQPQPSSAAPGYATFDSSATVTPGAPDNNHPAQATSTPYEQALAEQLRVQQAKPEIAYSHLRTLRPQKPVPTTPATTAPLNPAILDLANNNDLNIATIARQAQTPAPSTIAAPAVTATPDPAILKPASNNDQNVTTIAHQAQKQTDESSDEVVISLH